MTRLAPMLRRAVAIVLMPLLAVLYAATMAIAAVFAVAGVLRDAAREIPQLAEPMGLRRPFRWWAQLWQGGPPR